VASKREYPLPAVAGRLREQLARGLGEPSGRMRELLDRMAEIRCAVMDSAGAENCPGSMGTDA